MWTFDFATLNWSVVRNNTIYDNFPAQGSTTPEATPSGKYDPAFWVLGNDVWIFGGRGFNGSTATGLFYLSASIILIFAAVGPTNDLWRYSMQEDRWYFVAGEQVVNGKGLYDNSTQALPCSRLGAAYFSYNNELWIYGGDYSSTRMLSFCLLSVLTVEQS